MTGTESLDEMSPEELRGRIHELQSSQAELETKNEELRQLVATSREDSDCETLKDIINADQLLLNSTFNAIREGIVVLDNNLTIIYNNETMKQWAGRSLIGLPCRDAFPVCPGDCDVCRSEQSMQQTSCREQTTAFRTADGNVKTLHVQSYPLIDGDRINGVVQVADDITEIMSARLELERSEELSRLILNNTADAIFIIDLESMRFIDCNEQACKSLNMTRDEILSVGPQDITPDYDLAGVEAIFKGILDCQSQTGIVETTHMRKDGSLFPVEVFISATRYEEQTLMVSAARDITERIQSDMALRESEARYAMLQDVSGFGSWDWNLKTGEIYWSDEVYRLFDQDKSSFELTYDRYLESLHPDDRTPTREKINETMASGGNYDIENRAVLSDGSIRWLHGRGGLIRDKDGEPERLLGIIQDITARKDAEQQMQMLSYVVEHSPAIIIVTDPQGTIEYVNSKFTTITGYTAEEAIGQNPRILKSGSKTSEDYRQMWETIITGREWHGEVYNKTKDGRFYWAQVIISSITDSNGKIRHFIGMQEDISGRKGMELDLLRAKEAAEKANQAKSTFLASMSHELRTPLNSILGFSQILMSNRRENLSEKELGFVSRIITSGNLLLALIDDVLDLSKIESGRFDLAPEAINVSRSISASIEQVTSMAITYKITLVPPHVDADLYIRADERGIKQILINLLSNAIKYNRKGGEVRISGRASDEHFVIIEISDTGQGIPEEKLKELFTPFNRLGAEATNVEGTGIGLTITDHLVKMMGGTIAVNSTPGVGSTFTIRLPRERQPKLPGEDEYELRETDDPGARVTVPERKQVLYIEDNSINLELVENILRDFENLEMISATDARTGIQLARKSRPDLILLDINLPGMDGFEALGILQDTAETRAIPVVAVTARAMEGDEEKVKKAGFAGYVPKPIQLDRFKQVLMETMFS